MSTAVCCIIIRLGGSEGAETPCLLLNNPDDDQAESYYLIEVTENLFQALRQLNPLRNISHI